MHTHFETEIIAPAAPGDVWSLLEDMNTWRLWTDVFDVGEGTPSPTWREGVELRVGPALAGVRLWADVEIVEARRAERLTWRGSLYGVPGEHGFVFEPIADGRCRVIHREACGGFGGRLAVWSGAWKLLQRRFEQFNRDLLARLEESPGEAR
jgi:hypothetical protein